MTNYLKNINTKKINILLNNRSAIAVRNVPGLNEGWSHHLSKD